MGFLSCTFQRNLFQNTYNFIRIALIALAYDEKKIELHVPGYTTVPLQEKWVFFAKDNKILHPGNRELYLLSQRIAVLYQTTLHRDMQYLTGRHSVQINFVYLSAGVSRGLCKF